MDEEEDLDFTEYDLKEQMFHNTVREYIIFLLLFICIYLISWLIIGYFKRTDQDEFYNDADDRTVYKISLYLCTFSLSIAICATFLLPLSIISNEVLLNYPKSYYVKWLNHSLIQGIWNLVFLFSNLSIFVLLPFAYLFTESEGLSGSTKGVKSRIYETTTVLFLLGFVIFGISYVLSALIDSSSIKYKNLQGSGSFCLPFLYSCISFIGVMFLLLCTPFGLFKLFNIVSSSIAKPQFIYDLKEDLKMVKLEEMTLKRRLSQVKRTNNYIIPEPMFKTDRMLSLLNGALQLGLKEKLIQVNNKKKSLIKQETTSHLKKNVLYPLALSSIVILAIKCVLLACLNLIGLLVGLKAISPSAEFHVGLQSLSLVGWFGSMCEVIEVTFLALTSYVGLYTLPGISRISPKQGSLSLTLLIANTSLLLILSSALPLLSRIIGITNFDLLGDYGKIEWLGNMKIVLLYNVTFVAVTTLCVFKKLTTPVCKELIERIKNLTLGAKYL